MSVKQKIKEEFKQKMEEIYDFCTDLDSDGKLMVGPFSVEPETAMDRMANEALDKILDKYL